MVIKSSSSEGPIVMIDCLDARSKRTGTVVKIKSLRGKGELPSTEKDVISKGDELPCVKNLDCIYLRYFWFTHSSKSDCIF